MSYLPCEYSVRCDNIIPDSAHTENHNVFHVISTQSTHLKKRMENAW